MKKMNLCIVLGAILFTFSCQREKTQNKINLREVKLREAWLSAPLDASFADAQKEIKSYLFSSQEFSELTSIPNTDRVRFVLGYESGLIIIDAIGLDSKGKELGRIESKVLYASSENDKLAGLNQLKEEEKKSSSPVLKKHLLSPQTAFSGIEAWQSTLEKVKNINAVTSYDGLRIQNYTLESAVIKAIINKSGVENVGLFLGLNEEGKLTTILAGLDKENNIKKTAPTSNLVDGVYDFTEPCPPMCPGKDD